MYTSSNEIKWDNWGAHVIEEIKRISTKIESIDDHVHKTSGDIQTLSSDIQTVQRTQDKMSLKLDSVIKDTEGLKVKSSIFGALSGGIAAAIAALLTIKR